MSDQARLWRRPDELPPHTSPSEPPSVAARVWVPDDPDHPSKYHPGWFVPPNAYCIQMQFRTGGAYQDWVDADDTYGVVFETETGHTPAEEALRRIDAMLTAAGVTPTGTEPGDIVERVRWLGLLWQEATDGRTAAAIGDAFAKEATDAQ